MGRSEIAEILSAFHACNGTISQRAFAKQQGIPFQTFSYWLQRHNQITAVPKVKEFLESPAGLAFLHLLLVGLHVCFTKIGTASIRDLSRFLMWTGLDSFVASSKSHLNEISREIDEQIVAFGQLETRRLAEQMPEKLICLAQDETFHPGKMCLVVMDPATNFILLEIYANKRDEHTWTQLLKQALADLPVQVVWQTSDEAKSLLKHAEVGLGVPHAPDLFHIQQELVKATSRILASYERKAEEHYQKLMSKTPQLSRPLRAEAKPKLKRKQLKAANKLQQARLHREQVDKARQSISDAYHPYDLFSGQINDPQAVLETLKIQFKTIEDHTTHLGESSKKRIAKAKRLHINIVAVIGAFFSWVDAFVEQTTSSLSLQHLLKSSLIPGFYLLQAAPKEKDPERRRQILDKAMTFLIPFRCRDGPFAQLTEGELALLEKAAREAASHFQRSSSCVEGRNAQLARYHLGFHRLSDLRLASLTVIHNYMTKRHDGSTPAERFFQSKHRDLFHWLLNHIDLPARPHNRKRKRLASTAA